MYAYYDTLQYRKEPQFPQFSVKLEFPKQYLAYGISFPTIILTCNNEVLSLRQCKDESILQFKDLWESSRILLEREELKSSAGDAPPWWTKRALERNLDLIIIMNG